MSREFATLLTQLEAKHSLKAWSLIITFFGDSIVPRGGTVSASTVQTLMGTLGVGAGAVRTAFSRLAKDGWVERQKLGRYSFYRISDTGNAPFSNAAERIYATPLQQGKYSADKWLIAIRNPAQKPSAEWIELEIRFKGTRLTRNTVLFNDSKEVVRPALANADVATFPCDVSNVPEWLKQQLGPPSVANRYRNLQKQFKPLADNPARDGLTATAVRCLLIHEWRRLLLRYNELPPELMPTDWPFDRCHQFVADLYHKLTPAAEQWLNDTATGPDGKLRTSKELIHDRFR